MKTQVVKLARDVLTKEEFNEVISIIHMYTQNRDVAVKKISALDKKIGISVPLHTHYPIEYRGIIRPVHFYCKGDIEEGIRFPRNFVQNICGHVESCVKILLKKLDPHARTNIPLGPLLSKLEKFPISKDLLSKLKILNKVVYRRAKHDWNIPLRPSIHLFNKDDAILIYFIARKLAKQTLKEGSINLQVSNTDEDLSLSLTF